MGIAIFYFRVCVLLAIVIGAALVFTVPLIIFAIKKQKTARNFFIFLVAVTALMACCIGVWLASHTCHPHVNDCNYLGKNISDIEQKYGECPVKKVKEDGSGYAEYQTKDITGHGVEIEYDVYRMDFDSTGKVTHVECQAPIGG